MMIAGPIVVPAFSFVTLVAPVKQQVLREQAFLSVYSIVWEGLDPSHVCEDYIINSII